MSGYGHYRTWCDLCQSVFIAVLVRSMTVRISDWYGAYMACLRLAGVGPIVAVGERVRLRSDTWTLIQVVFDI